MPRPFSYETQSSFLRKCRDLVDNASQNVRHLLEEIEIEASRQEPMECLKAVYILEVALAKDEFFYAGDALIATLRTLTVRGFAEINPNIGKWQIYISRLEMVAAGQGIGENDATCEYAKDLLAGIQRLLEQGVPSASAVKAKPFERPQPPERPATIKSAHDILLCCKEVEQLRNQRPQAEQDRLSARVLLGKIQEAIVDNNEFIGMPSFTVLVNLLRDASPRENEPYLTIQYVMKTVRAMALYKPELITINDFAFDVIKAIEARQGLGKYEELRNLGSKIAQEWRVKRSVAPREKPIMSLSPIEGGPDDHTRLTSPAFSLYQGPKKPTKRGKGQSKKIRPKPC